MIQNGSLENEQTVIGTIETIAELAEKQGIGTPAIIVAGEVVSLSPEFLNELQTKKILKA